MKLGVFSPVLAEMPFKEMVEYLASLGVQQLEMGAGGYPGKAHFEPEVLLSDELKIDEIKQILADNNMIIAAISCHGNAVHPNKEIARQYHNDFENAVLLAEKLGVTTIVGFSGCPGGSAADTQPNWVTCSWPTDYLEVLKYQWNEVLIPYWKKEAEFCKAHGIEKIAFEMHPGFCVYNTSSLLKLREAVGDIIGANVDPSHLLWQGMDPVEVIRVLGKSGTLQIDSWDCEGKVVRCIDKKNSWAEEIVYTKAGPTKTMAPRNANSVETIQLHEPLDVEDNLDPVYRQLTDAIEGKAELKIKPEEALRVIKVMEAAMLSWEKNEVIKTNI